VLGGERYDALVEKVSGQSIPGTGFGLGFDRTLEACEEFGLVPDLEREGVMVITMDGINAEEGMTVLKKLRETGIAAEMYPSLTAKFDKKLRYANKKGIAYVAILGEQEVQQKKVTLKNMQTGEQEMVTVAEVINKIGKI
jgi:histidyl-tRNA synthetase